MLTNVHGSNDKQASVLSTQFPTMNIKGTNQVGPLGYNVDEKSKLMNSKLTNLNCKINLQERSYKTVPYLGRGNVDVGLENSLRLGDTLRQKKSVVQLNEKSQQDVNKYPMQKELKNKVNNPSNLIEESAVNGWIRGGLPSREMYKNQDYQCN
tara:strand:- start:145 stop:603 length:459 start_codon:yes stop_codon:yes gene_type:complete